MKQNSLSTLISCLNLTIFSALLLSEITSSVDPYYEACVPKNCGSQIIKYPFWIKDKQESYCGYPGFELTCQNDHPILQSPGNNYTVHQIFYNNQSLRIYNSAVINSTSGCLPPIGNISLKEDKFTITSDVSYLFLLSNCSSPLPKKLLDYKIGCAEETGKDWDLAMFDNNGNLSDALGKCRTDIRVPVELNRSDGIWDYLDVMRRGFVVNWTAGACSVCDKSGGLCGFDVESTFQFKCYCPDRPHFVSCKRRTSKSSLSHTHTHAGITLTA